MTKIIKVFISRADQDKLAKRYTITQRYDDFVLVQASPEDAEKLVHKYLVEDISDQFILHLGDRVIDTTRTPSEADAFSEEASFSFGMAAAAPAGGLPEIETETPGPHHYLVVFAGPIKSEWLEAVAASGGELRAPYQNFTYVVCADQEATGKISALSFVSWVGRLPTWARIASAIRSRPNLDDTSASLPRTRTLPATYLVEFFTPEDMIQARAPFLQLGAQITGEDERAGVLIVQLSGSEDERLDLLEALAAVHGVRSIRERAIKRISNDLAPQLLGCSVSMDVNGLGLSGEGEIIGVADTGLDSGDPASIHPDFTGRVVWIKSYPITDDYAQYINNPGGNDGPADLDTGHGTHVTGSALGSGAASQNLAGQVTPIRGLAYNARLAFQAIEQEMQWANPAFISKYGRYMLSGIPLDLCELFEDAYAQGVRIHSNSWGGGDPGAYDTQCEQLDRFVWEHKDFSILVAAGNDGSDRDRDGLVDPMSVSSPATAKNCITIGACESRRPSFKQATYGRWWPNDYPVPPLRDDRMADDPQQVAAFSSRGPTTDGRIKPDLVAPGTFILSTRSTQISPNNMAWSSFTGSRMYFFNGGTSMATPLAAGAAALVREYLRKVQTIANPSAALIKAVLIAGASRIKSASPKSTICDNEQGFGRINLDAVLAPAAPAHVAFLDSTNGLQTGQSSSLEVEILSNKIPLRVVLAYSDFPGRSLVNNLNLIVRSPNGRIYAGNSPSGKLALDNKNNLEVLLIPHPRAGKWQVQVIAANVPNGPQDFALVYRGHFGGL
jgi:serine protease AprX